MIPIHIITGFLGSGKTTFIQKLLRSEHGHKTLVLINELGEIGIDDILVKPLANNTYLLKNGCVCCTVLTDLKATLLDVQRMRNHGEIPHFDRIILETTGLANPASILSTIMQDTHLQGQLFVQGLTTIVDAENAELQYTFHPEWTAQVVAAQQILLSKLDRVDDERLGKLQRHLKQINADADSLSTDEINDIEALLSEQTTLASRKPSRYLFFKTADTEKHAEVKSLVVDCVDKIDWLVFGLWLNLLLKKYGENILRVKGILNIKDHEQPIVIHGVQHCIYAPEHLEEWPWEDKKSRIVFITRGIDNQLLQKSFNIFMNKG